MCVHVRLWKNPPIGTLGGPHGFAVTVGEAQMMQMAASSSMKDLNFVGNAGTLENQDVWNKKDFKRV